MRSATYRCGTAVAAPLLAGAVVLAGCGSPVRSASGPLATSPPHTTARPAGKGPVPGSEAGALHLVRDRIAHIVLPPGSARLTGPVPPVFGPAGQPLVSIPQQAVAYGLWSSPASANATAGLVQARPPAGTRSLAPVVIGLPKRWPVEVDDELTRLPAGIQGGELRLLIAPRGGGSVVWAVALARWYPPRSAAETVPPGMRAVTISAQLLLPRRRSVTRTFTSASVIRELTDMINGMHAAPSYGPRSCIAPMSAYVLAFAASPGGRPALVANAANGGCGTVAIVTRGTVQPPLDDQTFSLPRAAATLLGLNGPGAG